VHSATEQKSIAVRRYARRSTTESLFTKAASNREGRTAVEVHLQIGCIENNAIASCRLRFANGLPLSITSSKRRGFEAAAARDAMHPQMRDCTSETARLRPNIPREVVPALAGEKNVNALLSEFRGTCGNYQHLKHALHLPRPLIKLL
jgi:hypothetical protein